MQMEAVAHIVSDFPTKFGIPRQSGLAADVSSLVVFESAFRDRNALRGIDGFTHLWLLWVFSEVGEQAWRPTVRPPRLGGNTRLGVFATRSPFRPNRIGLSCVRLMGVEEHPEYGTVLRVGGADLMDGTPILDVKPYLVGADCHPDAVSGFAEQNTDYTVQVVIPPECAARFPADRLAGLRQILAQDPRPSYQNDPERVYGFPYAGHEVRFRVAEGVLTVVEIHRA